MTSFQLPALPPLPDYQDNAMVRRLSSLVPSRYSTRPAAHVEGETPPQPSNPQSRFWDMFSSASPPATAPPPSYFELFPDKTRAAEDDYDKKSAIQTAVVDAVADAKCAVMYDEVAAEPSAAISEDVKRPKKTERTAALSWLWMPLLVVVTSILMHAAMPYISMAVLRASESFPARARVLAG